MDYTWYKIPWRIFCIGKLGTEFYNRYKDKLGVSYALRVSDYHLEEFEPYYDLESYAKEHWSFKEKQILSGQATSLEHPNTV